MTFKSILCISNLSSSSQNAEYAALKLAYSFQSKLTILSCGEYYSHIPNNYFDENIIQPINNSIDNVDYNKNLEQKKTETIHYFSNLQKVLNINLNENIFYEIKLENEVSAAIDLLEEKKYEYDLIIVGKEQTRFWERLLFGSPAKEICDETKISTLLMPAGDKWKFWEPHDILVAMSLKGESRSPEIIGSQLAKKFSSQLTLMHIIDVNVQQFSNNFTNIIPIDYTPSFNPIESTDELVTQKKAELAHIIKNLEQTTSLQEIKACIEVGHVEENITEHLNSFPKNNLLIIGSRGENALKRFFLGNNTDAIEETCLIPLLIVFNKN